MKRIALMTLTSLLLCGCNTKDLRPADEKPLASKKVAKMRGTYYIGLAEAKLAQGRLDAAYRLSKDANDMLETDLTAKMLFARVCLEMGRPGEAMEALKPVVAEHPDNNPAIYLYGVCYEMMGEYEKALDLFGVIVRREPDSVDAAIAMAETQMVLGRHDHARKTIQSIMPVASTRLDAWEVAGRIDQALGNDAKAVESFRQCVAMAPKNPTYSLLLADSLWANSEKNKAASCYRNYIALVGKAVPVNVFRRLAVYYTETGNVALARQSYQAAVQADPGNPNHYLAQGRMECQQGDYARAIECCDRVLRNTSHSQEALMLKAYAQIESSKAADAVETLLYAQKSHPRLTLVYVMLGRAYTELGDDVKARKCFEFVLRASPNNQIAQRYIQYLRPEGPALATTAARVE
ncbi:MAG: tetratricopeptide repeat protein [Phycisphaerales bacterium]|jgi:tetratricopeptide (TPR) repeat protein|nr:tetratricopeptide repeat protein [Phycisphaerales bacterium]MBT7170948.1 tetratricopeptide repeat protein [Phycisphaerales bacterium]